MLGLSALLFVSMAGAPPAVAQTATIKPGTYDLEVIYGGGVIEGTLVLAFAGDSVDVKMAVGEHTPVFRSVVRRGLQLTLTGGAEGMPLMDTARFMRLHRSTIVNLARLGAVESELRGDGIVVLRTGERLKVTRSRRAELEHRLEFLHEVN